MEWLTGADVIGPSLAAAPIGRECGSELRLTTTTTEVVRVLVQNPAMAVPVQLRAIQHHLRTAAEHEQRDPVVAYYCKC